MTSGSAVRVAVVGGGYMGGGIAQTFAAHGVDCVLVDASAERSLERAERLQEEARRFAEDGLIPGSAAERIAEHLRPAESLEAAVADATYVSEAVFERADVKADVLSDISSLTGPEVIIGTNTSAISIGELARTVRHPERFLGVHWMNPAPFVPCVEIVPASETAESVLRAAVALMRDIGKVATVVADSPGFVANRLQYALFREAARMVEEGIATPADIDEVVSNSFGFRLPFFGPFAIADIAGLDVYRDGFATMERAFGERMGTPELLREHVEAGRHGLKTGQGFFGYPDGRAAEVARYRDRAYAGLARLREEVTRVDRPEDPAPKR
jgi:3-hydroxybutyryl-CoA dehydrogenase